MSVKFLSEAGKRNGRKIWRVACACGREFESNATNVRAGKVNSCGCARQAKLRKRNRTHGLRFHPLYKCWANIVDRCRNLENPHWEDYGGRGIKLLYRSFPEFLADVGNRPPGTSIDRINNDGHYEPGNCRWATPKQQAQNRRKRKK